MQFIYFEIKDSTNWADIMAVVVPDSNFVSNSPFFIIIILMIMLQLRQRKIKSWKLIVMPVILSLIAIPLVYNELYSTFNIVIIFIGLLIGVVMGLLIGKFMEIKIHEDGTLVLKGSYLVALIWIAIITIRIYGKNVLSSMGIIDLGLLTSMFLIMAVGAVISRRIFIYWKYLEFKKSNIPLKSNNLD